jgi:glycosyltransferase involved in cell wall biosynthesis
VPPALSVIIACRNGEGTLATQLTALSTQQCDVPWDVIVCDNGSTDDTVAVAQSFRTRLPGLTVIDASASRGPGFARNVGAQHTSAPLLAFCDADDQVAPGWLAAMVQGLNTHRFIAGRFDAQVLNRPGLLRSRPLQQDSELQHSPFGPDLPHAGAGNLGVHRSVFLGVGGFDPQVGCLEDTDLCWRIQLTGVPLVFWPDAVLHVRLRSSLKDMWRQGRAYGAAAALLEHRYPAAGNAQVSLASQPQPAGRGTSGPRALIRLISEQRSVGGFLWSLGWHVGHHSWTPQAQPAMTLRSPLPQHHHHQDRRAG